MSRTLYAWNFDGIFYLSAFARPRDDKSRPAMEFDSKAGLEDEVRRRGADLAWQDHGN